MERAVFQHVSTLQLVVHPSDLLIHLSTTALGPPKPPTNTTPTQIPSPTSELPLLSWAESVGARALRAPLSSLYPRAPVCNNLPISPSPPKLSEPRLAVAGW